MESLYFETNRLIQDTQGYFEQLNNARTDTSEVESNISRNIAMVNANCDRLDVLVFKVPAVRRPNEKMRVDQLRYDIRHLQAGLQSWQQKKERRELERSEREQLLSRRFTANSETSIDIDYSLQHHNSMMNAHQGVDDMLNTGHNALENLRTQREKLKGAHKRILDIGNTLGLSNTTMRLIEKRLSEDKYVLYIGMAVTLLVIFIFIYYFVF
ncbi:probable Golgi SNAP receptor complex member 2 [Contarinia nasturtii]|uniref:probable Golgi SNAP receptor complex member 2 n=1 Tax=Contarinia nasturtii TaxID=265458 RepID=UPI0012D42289|nr:probable Golgi SNAP receptor complex member 2 [Contarinia nasturtii]XP_031637494.1 probable Golgi SNAP receptor complex member 2 [Contarinia nasturtii]